MDYVGVGVDFVYSSCHPMNYELILNSSIIYETVGTPSGSINL